MNTRHIPKPIAMSVLLSKLIEACLKKGLLSEPENRLDAEGMLMIAEK